MSYEERVSHDPSRKIKVFGASPAKIYVFEFLTYYRMLNYLHIIKQEAKRFCYNIYFDKSIQFASHAC